MNKDLDSIKSMDHVIRMRHQNPRLVYRSECTKSKDPKAMNPNLQNCFPNKKGNQKNGTEKKIKKMNQPLSK